MNQEIKTQVVIKVANLDPKVQRLLKAYEEFKAAQKSAGCKVIICTI